MIDKLLHIITAGPLQGTRTNWLVAIAAGFGFLWLTSEPGTWVYDNIEAILTALGIGSVATMRSAIQRAIKG